MEQTILAQKAAARARLIAGAVDASGSGAHGGSDVAAGSTSAAVRAAAAAAVEQHLCDHYTRRPGIAPLCQAVARHLTAQGVPTGENDVVISGSAAEARYVALRSLGAGKTVYVHAAQAGLYAAALAFGGATPVPLDEESPLEPGAAGVLLVGRRFAAGEEDADLPRLRELAAWAAAGGLTVVADETGAPFGGYTPFASLPEMAARTLTLGGFAGAPGLAAWQISWFGGPKPLLAPVRDLKQSITICTTAPSQYAALAALAEHAAKETDKP
jgi:aspartate/methionine/tyrosine aminotransferase